MMTYVDSSHFTFEPLGNGIGPEQNGLQFYFMAVITPAQSPIQP